MEGTGFSQARAVPITQTSERVPTVRPSREFDEINLNPLHDEPKETGVEKEDNKQDVEEQ